MGFSFSGLSLVTAAAAELDSDVSVRQGGGSGFKSHDASFPSSKPSANRKGDASDSESEWKLALCACSDTPTPQHKDAPPQASPFSAVLTSAAGAPDSDSSSAGHDSLSILAAEELAGSDGATGQRLADLLGTTRGEAGIPLLRSSPQVLAHLRGELPGGRNARMEFAEASALLQPPRPTPLATPVVDARKANSPSGTEVANAGVTNGAAVLPASDLQSLLAAAREQSNPDAAIPNVEGDSAPETLAAVSANGSGQAQTPGSAEKSATERSQDLPSSVIEAAARNLSTNEKDLSFRKTVPSTELEHRNAAEAKPQNLLESTANAYATATAGKNGLVPEAAAAAAQTNAPRPSATALPQQQAGSGIDVPAAATSETGPARPSEVAFQGEMRLRSEGKTADTARANPQPGNLGGLTAAIREANSADSSASLRQQAESKTTPEGLQGNRRETFGRSADLAGGGDSFLGQDQSGGSFDRGTQQTTPLQGAASSQSASMTTPAKPAAIPAAARIDATPETATTETNQPARSLSFKVQTADRGAANVVLSDRGGQVHMTVRSSDPALTQSLRSDLGSLAGGLQQSGFDVKLWNPSSGSSTSDDSHADTLEFSQDDTRGPRHRHSPDDAEQRDGRRGEWPEEID